MTAPLPETFLSNFSSRTLLTHSHLCHGAMNCSLLCGLNTVDILYFDKFETTDIYNSLDSVPDNLQYFHSWCRKSQTDGICRMLCFFLLLWRIGVDCRSMMHLHETLWSKLWPLDYEIETCMFRFYLTIRLRAWDFYEVIVDEGEARINYHVIEIESE